MKKLIFFVVFLLNCFFRINSQTNVGLTATASHSSGGTSGTGYGPELYNNNAIPTCAITGTYQWGWVYSGANIDYIWSSNQTFDQIIFNKADRPMTSCAIQYWNGSAYVTFYNYNNSTACDHGITFSPITTSRLRFSNIQGTTNPNFREIQVISNCTPSTAATSISGGGTLCAGNSTTLAASGGTLGTNATEVWFEGSCNEAYSQNWGTQPFSVSNTTVNSVTNGILRVTSTSGDPMIHMNNIGSFDPAVYRYINLRYRVVSGTAGSTEIFFHNPTHNYAVGGETGFGSLISDGQWHILTIDMWTDPQYTTGGNIQGWRYDWATASGVTMDLDFISLDEKPIIGAGSSVTVTPTATTTYYTHRKGDCGVSACASTTVNYVYIPAPPSVSNNGPVCVGAPADLTVAGMAPSGKGVSMANNSTNKINGTAHTTVLNNHTIEFWVKPNRTVVLHTEQNSGVSGSIGSPTATTEYSFAIEPRNIGGSGCTPTNVGVGVSVGTNGVEVVQHGPCHFPVTLSYAGTISGWTHIAVVHISNVPYLYINGALVKSGLSSLYPTFPSSIVSMGYGYFSGQIDNIRVWNLARNQTNIINDMRLETPTVTTGLLQNLPLNGNGTALTGSNVTVNGTYVNPDYYTYTWTGTNAPTASVNETQTTGNLTTNTSYTVTASVSGCTSAASGTTTVTIDPVGVDGTLTATTGTSVCIGEAIGVSASGGNGTPHYWVQSPPGAATWNIYTNQNPNAASNGFTFTPTTPGTYRIHARWENACGFCWNHPNGMANCTSNAHVDFVVSATPSSATAGADQFECLSNTTTMAANNPAVGTGTWTWSPSAPTYQNLTDANDYNAEVSFSTSGTYTGTWTITNGTCTATNDAVDIKVNTPNPIVMTDATGTCTVTDNAWVHIYNAAGNIIASVNSHGQDLGDVTAQVYYNGGNSFNVATASGGCGTQAVLNRSFKINSANAPSGNVSLRLYFTDAELASLVANSHTSSTAPAYDPNGCEDDDDVNTINDLVVTQIHGATNEDGTFTSGDGTAYLLTPSNSGTGNSNFGGNYVEINVSQFSEFWIHGSEHNVPLPVELISFEAKAIDNSYIQLDWVTATEISNEGFEVQKSTDGQSFEKIAWVGGNGTSIEMHSYTLLDKNINTNATYYYRLKQIDFDGQYEYSEIRAASINGKAENGVGNFVPNPANHTSAIKFMMVKEASVNIELYDATGKLVIIKDQLLHEGNQNIAFDIKELAAGTYTAKIILDGKVYTRRLMINK